MKTILAIFSLICLTNLVLAYKITLSGVTLQAINQNKQSLPPPPDLDFETNYYIYLYQKPKQQIYLGVISEQEKDNFSKIIIKLFKSKVEKKIQERKEKQAIAQIIKPTIRPFKPKVAFYDGYTISTKMGTIYIPQEFDYRGTARSGNRYDYKQYREAKQRAEKRYNDLKEEALKQEKLKEEHDKKNEQLLAEYEEKVYQAKQKARSISNKEIWQEAIKYKFIISSEKL